MGVVCAFTASLLHFRFLWKEGPCQISNKDIYVTEKKFKRTVMNILKLQSRQDIGSVYLYPNCELIKSHFLVQAK